MTVASYRADAGIGRNGSAPSLSNLPVPRSSSVLSVGVYSCGWVPPQRLADGAPEATGVLPLAPVVPRPEVRFGAILVTRGHSVGRLAVKMANASSKKDQSAASVLSHVWSLDVAARRRVVRRMIEIVQVLDFLPLVNIWRLRPGLGWATHKKPMPKMK